MFLLLLITGLFGVLGMTWLFPCLALLVYLARGRGRQKCGREEGERVNKRLTLVLIVPVYKDPEGLRRTLDGIRANHAKLVEAELPVDVRTVVALDGPDKDSEAIAESFRSSTRVSLAPVYAERRGKWRTVQSALEELKQDRCDWVGLVDAGSRWEEHLLTTLFASPPDAAEVALAPSYRKEGAGLLETASWRLERHLKRLENVAGGPVSVHGATIFYRRDVLIEALDTLSCRDWLNDDVVIPLAIRSHNPCYRIRYIPSLWSIDSEERKSRGSALPRRKRLLLGNLEWISTDFWRRDPIVALLAGRRIVRILWGYWVLFLGVGLGGYIGETFSANNFLDTIANPSELSLVFLFSGLGVSLVLCLLLIIVRKMRLFSGLIESFLASLLTPALFIDAVRGKPVRWT